uniref:RING-type domain-containing protein n=1 Tax=Macrostomum lignano TaxID=282301 RepID=A0A1I8IGS9_9PLAT
MFTQMLTSAAVGGLRRDNSEPVSLAESVLEASDEASSPSPLRRCLTSAVSSARGSADLLRLQLVCDNEVRQVSLTWQPRRLGDLLRLFVDAFQCRLQCRRVDLTACRVFVLDRNRGAYRQVCDATREVRQNAVLLLVTPPTELMTADQFAHPGCEAAGRATCCDDATKPICQQLQQTAQLMRHPQAAQDYKDFSQQQPHQQQHLVCTCPREVKQALRDAGYFWAAGNGAATQKNNQTTESVQWNQFDRPAFDATSRGSTLENLQDEDTQHQQHQQQRLRLRRQTQQAAQHAPSNSSLDSAFSGQSTNSDASLSSALLTATTVGVTDAHRPVTKTPVGIDSLRLVRDQTAQLRRDFQSLREGHKDNVRAMNDMFQENMQSIKKHLSALNAQINEEADSSNLARFEKALRSRENESMIMPLCHHVGRSNLPLNNQRKAASQSPKSSRSSRPCSQQQIPASRLPITVPGSLETIRRAVLLRSIQAIVPDHCARMRALAAIDKSAASSMEPPPPPPQPQQPPKSPQRPSDSVAIKQQRRQQRAVVFSNTVKVDDGRELTILNGGPDEAQQHSLGDGERDDDVWKRQPAQFDAFLLQHQPGATVGTSVQHSASMHGFYCDRPV